MRLPDDNNLYFACIDLTGRNCLVVGGGSVAHEKIEGLLAAGARVRVVSPEADARIVALAEQGAVSWLARPFEDADVEDAFVVAAAIGDADLERKVASAAERHDRLVNVADVPELCNFILPAVVREGPLAVAISTAGASPALAQRIKRDIEVVLSRPFARLAEKLRDLRPWARTNLPTYEARREFFSSIVAGSQDPIELLERGDEPALDSLIARAQERSLSSTAPSAGGAPR